MARRIQSGADREQEQRACLRSGELGSAVAAYVRVSTRSQDAAYQRAAIEHAAQARGERVGAWFSDVASGRSMDRPALAELLAAIRAGHVRRLWVWRLDRLTRSGIVDTLSAVDEMKRHGCECASVADGFALDGAAADVILSVLAWAAQMERAKIAENQAAARERMEAEGRPWGRPTKVTAALLERLLELRRLGFTHKEIAAALHISRSHAGRILRDFDRQAAAENKPLQSGDPVRS